jgi:plasmid stabilization system protein ParE
MIVELEAREELLAAAEWYEEQRAGLGDELLSAIDAALVRVESSPTAFPPDPFDDRARRALLPRFPYVIVFVLHEDTVRVVAFAHTKRLPGYWTSRV